jgi:hypothetical protein
VLVRPTPTRVDDPEVRILPLVPVFQVSADARLEAKRTLPMNVIARVRASEKEGRDERMILIPLLWGL